MALQHAHARGFLTLMLRRWWPQIRLLLVEVASKGVPVPHPLWSKHTGDPAGAAARAAAGHAGEVLRSAISVRAMMVRRKPGARGQGPRPP